MGHRYAAPFAALFFAGDFFPPADVFFSAGFFSADLAEAAFVFFGFFSSFEAAAAILADFFPSTPLSEAADFLGELDRADFAPLLASGEAELGAAAALPDFRDAAFAAVALPAADLAGADFRAFEDAPSDFAGDGLALAFFAGLGFTGADFELSLTETAAVLVFFEGPAALEDFFVFAFLAVSCSATSDILDLCSHDMFDSVRSEITLFDLTQFVDTKSFRIRGFKEANCSIVAIIHHNF